MLLGRVQGMAGAVVEVDVVMQRRRDAAQLRIALRLQRRDQDQVRLERVQPFQIGLDGGAHVHHLGVLLVLFQEAGHIVLGDARHRRAQLVQRVQLAHVEGHHPLRPLVDLGGAQLMLDGDRDVGGLGRRRGGGRFRRGLSGVAAQQAAGHGQRQQAARGVL